MSTTEERAHELGDEFRTRANADERQFVNWLALASAGGIGLLLHFIADEHNGPIRLNPAATVPPLISWLIGIMCAGVALYGMVREQGSAGNSFHAQGRRERQKAKLNGFAGAEHERATIEARAKAYQDEADRHHVDSRLWLVRRELAMKIAVCCFSMGALWSAVALALNLTFGTAR
ncbi:hypothetical protein [Novosphingobium sp. P6W]|uniref:hypothetical protein n=1 Tax=Novosphingobium sp. P6W TaxID=1609758 RepID=UPI0005C2E1B3|nr:hypothetical protein [Novosphingobium sp. P6W]AXB80218.1 hypothetical protein TQ38_026885 [Novosphingobium sp. P6W]KIS31569.1 hypothetical protein TQ38_15655 [Novosphingobium sp. P6W]